MNTYDLSEFYDEPTTTAVAVTTPAPPDDAEVLSFRENMDRVRVAYKDRYDAIPENIVAEIAKMAFFNPKDMFKDGKLKRIEDMDSQTTAGIAGMKVMTVRGSEDGWVESIQFKFADKLKALGLLVDIMKMVQKDVPGATGHEKDITERTTNDRARRIAFALHKAIIETQRDSEGNVAPKHSTKAA